MRFTVTVTCDSDEFTLTANGTGTKRQQLQCALVLLAKVLARIAGQTLDQAFQVAKDVYEVQLGSR